MINQILFDDYNIIYQMSFKVKFKHGEMIKSFTLHPKMNIDLLDQLITEVFFLQAPIVGTYQI